MPLDAFRVLQAEVGQQPLASKSSKSGAKSLHPSPDTLGHRSEAGCSIGSGVGAPSCQARSGPDPPSRESTRASGPDSWPIVAHPAVPAKGCCRSEVEPDLWSIQACLRASNTLIWSQLRPHTPPQQTTGSASSVAYSPSVFWFHSRFMAASSPSSTSESGKATLVARRGTQNHELCKERRLGCQTEARFERKLP
jgi:hypothetical protein